MSDLQNQVNLLNDYVRTLERQNQSKTNQIHTLTDQNNHLIIECQTLRKKIKHSTTLVSNTSTIQRLQNQLKQVKAAYNLLLQNNNQNFDAIRLKQTITRIQNQKIILLQFKERIQRQWRELGFKSTDNYLSKFKQYEIQFKQIQQKMKIYQTRIIDYQRRIPLLTNQLNIKTSQIQRLNDKLKSGYMESSYTNTNIRNYQIQIQNYQKKITQLSNQILISKSQIQRLSIKQKQNLTLKGQIQSLNSKINTLTINTSQMSSLQNTINSLRLQQRQYQNQKQKLRIKVTQIQKQLGEKNNQVSQLKLRQQYLNNNKQTQYSNKERQIDNFNSTIRSLRTEIQQHKRTITYKQTNIRNLQSKISTFDYSKSSQITSIQKLLEQKNNQINKLIENHNQKVSQLLVQIEKYKSLSYHNTQNINQINSLKQENSFLKKQSQNNSLLIQQLQRQKENLKFRIRDLEEQLTRTKSAPTIQVSEIKRYQQNQNGDLQLKKIVKQLREQLEQVKKSNAVIHTENYQMQKYLTQLAQSQLTAPFFGNQSISLSRYHSPQHITSLHQQSIPFNSKLRGQYEEQLFGKNRSRNNIQSPYFKSQVNIQKKKQQIIDKSILYAPVRDVKSPSHQNKQKWQNLQRKISALRVENDELKKTLLYD